jgi:glutathione peroxidase
MTGTIGDFDAALPDGTRRPLSTYAGEVLLVVNVASKCGFTPQYRGLEALYRQYKDRGFHILAFPCNQFGKQEPGDAAEIASFCTLTYDVTFPLFAKIDVNGADADPLWGWLKAQRPGLFGIRKIKWNFTKFLVGRDGKVAERYAPTTRPETMDSDITALL